MSIQLGLCCIHMNLRYQNPPIFTNRSCKLATIFNKGLDEAIRLANLNLDDLKTILQWNYDHGIFVFRMSSNIFPHGSNPDLIDKFGKKGEEYMNLMMFKTKLKEIGDLSKKLGIRLTFHPGQYVQIASPTESVHTKSLLDLKMHALVFDYMELDQNSVMVIHGGGTYNDKPGTLKRMNQRIKELPPFIKQRLVLENDEKSYTVNDLLSVCKENDIPLVFDYFHLQCYNKKHLHDINDIYKLTPDILAIWKKRNIKPKFHLSEQGDGVIGSHSTIINEIPQYFFDILETYKLDFDLMIEAKGKEVSLALLYAKYPNLFIKKDKKLLPSTIPKQALKDVKIDKVIRDSCLCNK